MPVSSGKSSGKRSALGHRAKRWLYIVHRWIGIFSCLLFAIWFLSGLVMIYVPFPALTAQERLVGLQPIDWPRVKVQPAAALAAADITSPKAVTLEMRDGAPVWRIDPWDGPQRTVAASTHGPLKPVDAAMARRIASRFGRGPVDELERIDRDQWTVAGSFDRHRPLWKASLRDTAGMVLYVSSTTGAVVLDTTAHERFWNWLGSVPHWLYPTILRQNNDAWRQVVMWVSGPCILAAVTGMWIGILRTRLGRRRFGHGRRTPYRGWMHWHHVAGLVGGFFLLTWIFSGWLSVDPFRLFFSGGIETSARAAYQAAAATPDTPADRLGQAAKGAKRIELHWLAGRPLFVVERAAGIAAVLDARTLEPAQIDQHSILAAARALLPGARIVQVDRLSAPDSYWYDVGELPRLPVLRIRFDDPARTWVHIDPRTGALLGDIDARGRLYRWLFDLLHKWDLNLLTLNRPVWDVLLWLLSIAGTVTSISGIYLGWARLMVSKARRVHVVHH